MRRVNRFVGNVATTVVGNGTNAAGLGGFRTGAFWASTSRENVNWGFFFFTGSLNGFWRKLNFGILGMIV